MLQIQFVYRQIEYIEQVLHGLQVFANMSHDQYPKFWLYCLMSPIRQYFHDIVGMLNFKFIFEIKPIFENISLLEWILITFKCEKSSISRLFFVCKCFVRFLSRNRDIFKKSTNYDLPIPRRWPDSVRTNSHVVAVHTLIVLSPDAETMCFSSKSTTFTAARWPKRPLRITISTKKTYLELSQVGCKLAEAFYREYIKFWWKKIWLYMFYENYR